MLADVLLSVIRVPFPFMIHPYIISPKCDGGEE